MIVYTQDQRNDFHHLVEKCQAQANKWLYKIMIGVYEFQGRRILVDDAMEQEDKDLQVGCTYKRPWRTEPVEILKIIEPDLSGAVKLFFFDNEEYLIRCEDGEPKIEKLDLLPEWCIGNLFHPGLSPDTITKIPKFVREKYADNLHRGEIILIETARTYPRLILPN